MHEKRKATLLTIRPSVRGLKKRAAELARARTQFQSRAPWMVRGKFSARAYHTEAAYAYREALAVIWRMQSELNQVIELVQNQKTPNLTDPTIGGC
jgi:hypothetical protein